MLLPQQITAAIDELDEEQVKALLVEIFISRNYGNQEMIMKINEIAERLEMAKNKRPFKETLPFRPICGFSSSASHRHRL